MVKHDSPAQVDLILDLLDLTSMIKGFILDSLSVIVNLSIFFDILLGIFFIGSAGNVGKHFIDVISGS